MIQLESSLAIFSVITKVMRYLALLALLGCSSDPKPTGTAGSAAALGKKGSANGFSAGLSADLAREGGGPITAPPPMTGSGSAAPAPAAKVAESSPPPSPSPSPSPSPAPSPSPSPSPSPAPPAKHAPVKVSAELAAIKLDLEPNWVRDQVEAGTISFVLNISQSGDTRTFVFHYGYDDPKAPPNCDDYAKWLTDTKTLAATLHRQRSGACYVEGLDDKGVASFRAHVVFGGKALWCGGPRYRDPVNNALGDLRDKVVDSGEKICQTLAL